MVDASLRSTILDILFELNRDLGISLIYVTHDLTTAYQVADSIVVLHGGRVMEVGATEQVIHDPRHPYTRALIQAVPSPDPDTPWNLDEVADAPARFVPPGEALALYRTDPLRAVAEPLQPGRQSVTAAEIQMAVNAAKRAAPA
jgi:peptide/nickel transport system ATP-binding protein